jgi:acetylornithine deacetylase/succinyl-diaminopimelate desuccinylase-like protein
VTVAASGWEQRLVDLVRTPSHRGIPRQEERAAGLLAAWLRAHGIEVTLDEVVPGRPNVMARVAGAGPGRTLLFCGHTDTVPLNDGEPGVGFSGEIRDGRLFGRGACDMKGAIAAMAAALVALSETGALSAGQVVLAAIVDEEMESLGAERLVATGFRADGAIVGEPTENRLALGHKGLEWIEVEFQGKAAHGGTPEAGINVLRIYGLTEALVVSWNRMNFTMLFATRSYDGSTTWAAVQLKTLNSASGLRAHARPAWKTKNPTARMRWRQVFGLKQG